MVHRLTGWRAFAAAGNRQSGTTHKISRAATALSAPRTANRPRQPTVCTTNSAGAVAVTAPSAPSITNQPLTRASRSAGNHSTMALKPAINARATPRPIRARPTINPARLSASAKTSAPALASSMSALWMVRGPCRSSSTPNGNCAAANTRKYTDVSSPRSAAPKPELGREVGGDQGVDGAKQVREVVAGGERQQHAADQARTRHG